MRQVQFEVPKTDNEFVRCMKFVLEQECRRKKDGTLDDGYVNDPHDPGGETKYGISKKAYPMLDIKNLTIDDALALYYRDYWGLAKSLVFPMNLCVFDCAVNQGTKRAKQFFVAVPKDWKLYIEQRKQHYLALLHGKFLNNPNRMLYQKAWFSRLNSLIKYIEVTMASEKST